jgi:hypothetical protein
LGNSSYFLPPKNYIPLKYLQEYDQDYPEKDYKSIVLQLTGLSFPYTGSGSSYHIAQAVDRTIHHYGIKPFFQPG